MHRQIRWQIQAGGYFEKNMNALENIVMITRA